MLPGLLSVIGIDAEGLARNFAGSRKGLAALLVANDELAKPPNIAVMDGQNMNQANCEA